MAKRVALVVYPTFDILDLAILSVIGVANQFVPGSYVVDVVSMDGGPVASRYGVSVDTAVFADVPYHTAIVAGSIGIPPPLPGLVAQMRNVFCHAQRVVSSGTGAFLLADAGMLDGRQVTTNLEFAEALTLRHRRIDIAPDRLVNCGGMVWSCAGAVACIDLMLAIVEADLGEEVGRQVANAMAIAPRQVPAPVAIDAKEERIRKALAYMKENLRTPLCIEQLAVSVNWSRRHFSRTFQSETGMSPAKAIEKLRVDAARRMIEHGHSSIARIADHAGFGDDERMRRAFLRVLGESPQAILKRARPVRITVAA